MSWSHDMKTAVQSPPPANSHTGLLRQLGLIGMDQIEPIVIAALSTGAPMLLIGPHGTAKSLLLCRLCEALGITWRHYNASLLNYDDLVGYPLPDEHGGLRFVQTPASIWDAQAVFLDEISRCRPDMQNRLFSIIHEKKVQGMPIERLIYRWAAMNPPVSADADGNDGDGYIGSEPLDAALADRFNFVVRVPRWHWLSEADREAVICGADAPLSRETAAALAERIELVRKEIELVTDALGPAITQYVRMIAEQAAPMGLALSGRRAAMLYRNITAVHAARLVDSPSALANDSAWMALEHSIPQRAEGKAIQRAPLLLAHNSVWAMASMDRTDPRRLLLSERCPVRRAIRAMGLDGLSGTELSAYIADGLAEAPPGARHALAAFVVSSPAAARLNAAVAEQAAELSVMSSVAQHVEASPPAGSAKHSAWQQITKVVASLVPDHPETIAVANVLAGLFADGEIDTTADVTRVLESWRGVRRLCKCPDKQRGSST